MTIDNKQALLDSLKSHKEAAYYLLTVLGSASPTDLALAVENVIAAKLGIKPTDQQINKFIEILVPAEIYKAFLETGKLRLIDWQSVFEMAQFIGFDITDRVEAINRDLARRQIPNASIQSDPSNSERQPWARVEVGSIEGQTIVYAILEEQKPELELWMFFKSQMSRCLEVSLS
jgi:hypothetical protein